MRQRAFSLVELLVVIGIVGVLVGILLPVVGRAREMGQRTTCLSHLRTLGAALTAYTNDNEGYFPSGARLGDPLPEDWIYWQQGRSFSQSRIIKFAGPDVFTYRCPTDEYSPREAAMGYVYSYAMNAALAPIPAGGTHAYGIPLRKVKNASGKILAFDESSQKVDDGWGVLDPAAASPEWTAIRHDPDRVSPDTGTNNNGAHCNVVFCDGHGDWITRGEAQSQAYFDPNY